jgi:hypothetical protein
MEGNLSVNAGKISDPYVHMRWCSQQELSETNGELRSATDEFLVGREEAEASASLTQATAPSVRRSLALTVRRCETWEEVHRFATLLSVWHQAVFPVRSYHPDCRRINAPVQ